MAGTAVVNSGDDYRARLRSDRRWAREEVDLFFGRENEVYKSLRRIVDRLESLGVPYALVGGLALNEHGYERLTTDVDLRVTAEGLRIIHENLEGLGYVPPFAGSKHLMDTTSGVRIEFLVTGQFPGDGKPKPVVFPDPAEEAVEIDGIRVLSLPKLIDLKLASGLSNERRGQDIIDVQKLIESLKLSAAFAETLDPSVRPKFLDLHRIVTEVPDPYAEG
jgi:hypothetical protein